MNRSRSRSRVRAFMLGLVTLASVSAVPAIAQSPSGNATAITTSNAGPRRDAAQAGFRDEGRAARAAAAPIRSQTAGMGAPIALIVVGVAALLVGAVVGSTAGTLIMVGGAVLGLIGLFQFLQ